MTLGIFSSVKADSSRVDEERFLARLDGFLEDTFYDYFIDSNGAVSYPRKYSRSTTSVNGRNTLAKYRHPLLGDIFYFSKLTAKVHQTTFLLEAPSIVLCQRVGNALAYFTGRENHTIERNGLILPFDYNKFLFRELDGRNVRCLA